MYQSIQGLYGQEGKGKALNCMCHVRMKILNLGLSSYFIKYALPSLATYTTGSFIPTCLKQISLFVLEVD